MIKSVPAILAAIQTNFNTVFNKVYNGYTPLYKGFGMAMETPSNTSTEVYPFLDQISGVREWVGPRVVKSASLTGYSLKNKLWENTIGVKRETIEDDQYGVYTPIVSQMGATTAMHPDQELFDLFWSGLTDTCVTGKAFFATDHPIGKTTFSNLTTGAGNVLATDGVAYGAVLSALRQVLSGGAKNNVITMNPEFVLVVPPALETTAKKLLEAEFLGLSSKGAENNIWKGSAQLFVNPLLSQAVTGVANSDKAWYVYCKNASVKPFIYQKRSTPEVSLMTKATDEHVFLEDEYLYGVRIRDAFGYGLPHLIHGVTPW